MQLAVKFFEESRGAKQRNALQSNKIINLQHTTILCILAARAVPLLVTPFPFQHGEFQ